MDEPNTAKRKLIIVIIIAVLVYAFLLTRSGGWFSPRDILRAGFNLLVLRFNRIPTNVILFGMDLGIFLLGLAFWMGFFAQFVLPLRTVSDRLNAWSRLMAYISGQHGMAIRIENGEIKQRAGELERRGQGVIVLDSASAAVLRNPTSFTQAVSPGIVFTRKDEFVVEAVDLRRQTRPQPPLGPRDGENPFEPKGQESDETYAERQAHRHETSGLTRDGIEVVPNIMAALILSGPPRRRGQPYVFNRNSVWKAVTAGRLNADSNAGTIAGTQSASQVPMTSLPAYLAADVFREGLRKFTFDELFNPLDDGKTAYQRILHLVQARLTQPEVDDLDDTGHPTRKKVQSREFQILQERGIRVLGAVVMNPRFLPEIENRMVNQWKATWLQRAQMERIQIEKRRADAALEGKQDALKQFAQIASQKFDGRVFRLPVPKNAQEEQAEMQIALERLIQGTLQGAASDSQIYLYLSGGEVNLNNILDWVRGAGE